MRRGPDVLWLIVRHSSRYDGFLVTVLIEPPKLALIIVSTTGEYLGPRRLKAYGQVQLASYTAAISRRLKDVEKW